MFSVDLQTFARCFTDKILGRGTFPNSGAGLGYRLIPGPFFWDCPTLSIHLSRVFISFLFFYFPNTLSSYIFLCWEGEVVRAIRSRFIRSQRYKLTREAVALRSPRPLDEGATRSGWHHLSCHIRRRGTLILITPLTLGLAYHKSN
jgi:hypothetical protein